MNRKAIILRTETGRYVWIEALEIVEFIKKGDQRGYRTIPLYKGQNTPYGALRQAVADAYGGLCPTEQSIKGR